MVLFHVNVLSIDPRGLQTRYVDGTQKGQLLDRQHSNWNQWLKKKSVYRLLGFFTTCWVRAFLYWTKPLNVLEPLRERCRLVVSLAEDLINIVCCCSLLVIVPQLAMARVLWRGNVGALQVWFGAFCDFGNFCLEARGTNFHTHKIAASTE